MKKKFDPSPFISKVGQKSGKSGKQKRKDPLEGFDRTLYQSAFNPKEKSYKEVACKALGLPFELEEGKIYHHLGNIDISSSPEATRAVVGAYFADTGTYVYSFVEYMDALKRLGKIQGQLDTIERHKESEETRWQQHQDKLADYFDKDPEKRGREPSFYEKREPDPPSGIDIEFLDLYHLETHTADFEGYKNYILYHSSDLYSFLQEPLPFYLEENPNKPHGYVLGTSGSGKSELLKLLIHTYVTHDKYGSVVVIDPTSDFVSQVAKWQEFNVSERLIYIRPTLFKGKTPCLNPFEIHGIDATDYSEEALNVKRVIAQELVEAIGMIVTGGGGYLTAPMQNILTSCVLVLLDKEDATLEDLSNFMSDDIELINFAQKLEHYDGLVTYFSNKETGFLAKGNKQTKEAIARRLHDLLIVGIFKKLTCGKSTFDLEQAVHEKKVILFDLGKGSIGKKEGPAFGRLVIAMLIGMAFRRKERVPCSIIIDECHNFVSESLEEILNEARKYKLFLTMAQPTAGHRMLPQLKDVVLETTSLQIIGGTSPSGAKRNADIIGVTPEDIKQLETGEFYVRVRRSGAPIKFKARGDLLDWKNCVTEPTWNRIRNGQLKYYTHTITPEEQHEGYTTDGAEWDYQDLD